MNDLLVEAQSLKISAQIGSINNSILAYCGDILLLSMSENHMNRLLTYFNNYAHNWKLEFNSSKSVSYSSYSNPIGKFYLGKQIIPCSEGFTYLGLPIGNEKFIENFLSEKFRNCEKSMYSLRSVGCKPKALNPKTVSFIFKQFCQSIIRFGLDNLFIKKSFINLLNVRQNILIKNVLGLNYFSRSKALLNELRIESYLQLYLKHKIYDLRQFRKNEKSNLILEFLQKYYNDITPNKFSFISQLNEVKSFTDKEWSTDSAGSIKAIDSSFECNEEDLRVDIRRIIATFSTHNAFATVKSLNDRLRINFIYLNVYLHFIFYIYCNFFFI